MMRPSDQLVWHSVAWPRPLDPDDALQLLDRLAADHGLGRIVFEARAAEGKITYLIGCAPEHTSTLIQVLSSHLHGIRLSKSSGRADVTSAAKISLSQPSLALSIDRVLSVSRSVLAGLASASGGETLVLQVMLGERVAPRMFAGHYDDPHASWLDLIFGTVRPASTETKASLKTKAHARGFHALIRIGVAAANEGRARQLVTMLYHSLKTAETTGAKLHLSPESPDALNQVRNSWLRPPVLTVNELISLIGWPLGEGTLPGVGSEHPRVLPPPASLPSCDRAFAASAAAGKRIRLGVSLRDSLQHTVLLGPTGSGKSTAMLSMICADIKAGRSVLVIDPKSDLTRDILARIPEERAGDVVVIDPAASCPVGLNPLISRRQNPALVADSILAVFKELFADSWGPRTQDILTSALLTLALYPNSTLVWLPALLTDASFRHRLTSKLTDRIGLQPFWASYEALSPQQRAQVIAPVMNKLRQFLLRPALRSVLGQTHPRFQMSDLFEGRKIVLVSLNKGLIGAEGARLLGSLVVAQLWPLILGRAAVSPEKRHVVSVFIDEVQDYLALPTDLADALSQARGLGVGFTLAHQYRSQLPTSLRAGIDANARNKIVFGLNATDARDMAAMAPELDTQDFMLLPRYGVYAHLMNNGHSTGWISGQTLPPMPATYNPAELAARSAVNYGVPADQVEAEVLQAIGFNPSDVRDDDSSEPIGRRKRGQS